MRNRFGIVVLTLLGSSLAIGCSTSRDADAEPPEFQAEWTRLVGGGAQVQHVGATDGADSLTGALGASATDGVSALLSTAIPSGVAQGPLTAPEVDRTVRERMSSIRMCQAQASRRGGMPSGKVIVRFQVGTDGSVQNVQVDGPRFARTPLLGCIASSVRRLQFRPSTGQPFAAAYPFIFAGS